MKGNLRVLPVVVLLGYGTVPTFAQLEAPNARRFEVALIGDIPYSGLQVLQYPNVIAEINENKVDFTVHVGDIKAGNTVCSDDVYPAIRDSFNSFQTPLIYTPGDNEWTDCHRRNNGSYDPLERLALIRQVFYPDDRSLGAASMPVKRQSDRQEFATYRENAMWSLGSALLVTIHVVGSNNGLNQTLSCTPTPADPCQNPYAASMNAEYAARNAANLAWIEEAFAAARDRGYGGIMFLMQANLNIDLPPTHPNRTGFNDTIALLRSKTLEFGGPVVLVHDEPESAWTNR